MSDAEVEVEGEGKKKSPLVKIIIFAVAGLVAVVGIVVARRRSSATAGAPETDGETTRE